MARKNANGAQLDVLNATALTSVLPAKKTSHMWKATTSAIVTLTAQEGSMCNIYSQMIKVSSRRQINMEVNWYL